MLPPQILQDSNLIILLMLLFLNTILNWNIHSDVFYLTSFTWCRIEDVHKVYKVYDFLNISVYLKLIVYIFMLYFNGKYNLLLRTMTKFWGFFVSNDTLTWFQQSYMHSSEYIIICIFIFLLIFKINLLMRKWTHSILIYLYCRQRKR